MSRFWFHYALLIFLASCIPKQHIRKVTITRRKNVHEPLYYFHPPVTIWVHGTFFIKRPLFHDVFNSTPGLKLANDIPPDNYIHKLIQAINTAAPHSYPDETFYVFGWSGKLSSQERRDAGKILYQEIEKLAAAYNEQYGHLPIIRILSHSHGGTVSLNMARYKKEPLPFHIDELVLMACPVQKSTKRFIEDELFDKTIALYSTLDMVQVLAPQMMHSYYITKKGNLRRKFHWPPFSRRCFEEHPKLAQVKLKINGRALFHTEFTSQHFVALLPSILRVIDRWHSSETRCHNQLLCIYTKEEEVGGLVSSADSESVLPAMRGVALAKT